VFLVNGYPFESLPVTSVPPTGYDGSNVPYWDTKSGNRIRDVREVPNKNREYAGYSGSIPWSTGENYTGFLTAASGAGSAPSVSYSVPSVAVDPFSSSPADGDMPFELSGGELMRSTPVVPTSTRASSGPIIESDTPPIIEGDVSSGINWGWLLIIGVVLAILLQKD
jgi:hypothetical protein